MSRLTACQSTLTINDTSITKFEKNEDDLVEFLEILIQNSFKFFDFSAKNENNLIGCSASNNGYEKRFGCAHIKEKYI